jgi:hypothetical protein
MRSSILVAAAAFAAIVSDALAFAPGAALPSVAGRVTPTGALSGLEMMRHGNRKAKLGLAADQRKALMRALTTEVIRHGRITTTLARAKAVRGEVCPARPQKGWCRFPDSFVPGPWMSGRSPSSMAPLLRWPPSISKRENRLGLACWVTPGGCLRHWGQICTCGTVAGA